MNSLSRIAAAALFAATVAGGNSEVENPSIVGCPQGGSTTYIEGNSQTFTITDLVKILSLEGTLKQELETARDENSITTEDFEDMSLTLRKLILGSIYFKLTGKDIASELLIRYLEGSTEDIILKLDPKEYSPLGLLTNFTYNPNNLSHSAYLEWLESKNDESDELPFPDTVPRQNFLKMVFPNYFSFLEIAGLGESYTNIEELLHKIEHSQVKNVLITSRRFTLFGTPLENALGTVEVQMQFELDEETGLYVLIGARLIDTYKFDSYAQQQLPEGELGKRVIFSVDPNTFPPTVLAYAQDIIDAERNAVIIYDGDVAKLAETLGAEGYTVCIEVPITEPDGSPLMAFRPADLNLLFEFQNIQLHQRDYFIIEIPAEDLRVQQFNKPEQ